MDERLERLQKFLLRSKKIEEWLRKEAPYIFKEQKHLNTDTVESFYWRYGYQSALRDVLEFIQADNTKM